MLQEANGLKSRAGEAIDRELAVIHIGEWNTSQVFVNQMVDFIYALSNSCRANLFIIAYDDNLIPHVDRHQRRNIGLAGFIDNNHVETIAFHVKLLLALKIQVFPIYLGFLVLKEVSTILSRMLN